jgi:hypothetical protein
MGAKKSPLGDLGACIELVIFYHENPLILQIKVQTRKIKIQDNIATHKIHESAKSD